MDDALVYLVPIGRGRHELYSEPPAEAASVDAAGEFDGFWREQLRRLHERWRQAAHAAHATDGAAGRLAAGRDWMVRRIAESIAEQRTLWSLRRAASAVFVYPSDLSSEAAGAARERLLTHARRHHGRWLLADTAGVAVTAVLMVLPGPNLIGYYFVFRAVGHYLSWLGARHALERTSWHGRAEPALSDLGRLADVPGAERAERVARLAAGLHAPRLAAFFDRVAASGR